MTFIDLVSERLEELDPHVLDRCADEDNDSPRDIEVDHEAVDARILRRLTINDNRAVSIGAEDREKVMESDETDEEDEAKDCEEHHIDDLNDVVDVADCPAFPLETQDNERDARDQRENEGHDLHLD